MNGLIFFTISFIRLSIRGDKKYLKISSYISSSYCYQYYQLRVPHQRKAVVARCLQTTSEKVEDRVSVFAIHFTKITFPFISRNFRTSPLKSLLHNLKKFCTFARLLSDMTRRSFKTNIF